VKGLTVFFQVVVLLSVTLTGKSQSSNVSPRSTPVGIGETAPDFTLEDQSGNKVTLSSARNSGPVVLVFYRGYW